MVIKQQGTVFDDVLLKIILPILYSSGIRIRIPGLTSWHRTVDPREEQQAPVELAPRRREREGALVRVPVLSNRRAA